MKSQIAFGLAILLVMLPLTAFTQTKQKVVFMPITKPAAFRQPAGVNFLFGSV